MRLRLALATRALNVNNSPSFLALIPVCRLRSVIACRVDAVAIPVRIGGLLVVRYAGNRARHWLARRRRGWELSWPVRECSRLRLGEQIRVDREIAVPGTGRPSKRRGADLDVETVHE